MGDSSQRRCISSAAIFWVAAAARFPNRVSFMTVPRSAHSKRGCPRSASSRLSWIARVEWWMPRSRAASVRVGWDWAGRPCESHCRAYGPVKALRRMAGRASASSAARRAVWWLSATCRVLRRTGHRRPLQSSAFGTPRDHVGASPELVVEPPQAGCSARLGHDTFARPRLAVRRVQSAREKGFSVGDRPRNPPTSVPRPRKSGHLRLRVPRICAERVQQVVGLYDLTVSPRQTV